MVVLKNIAEARALLEGLKVASTDVDLDLRFEGDLEYIRIHIAGDDFHGSITGELSRGLASYQDEIYRAAKFAIYGKEGRIQLTVEQRAAFELVIEVREGSSGLMAPVNKIAEGLAAGLANMDPTTLAIVTVTVVLILVGGRVASKVWDGIQETKQKKDALDAAQLQAETSAKHAEKVAEEMTIMAATLVKGHGGKVLRRFEDAQSEGVKNIVRSVPSATAVDFAGVTFSAEDIKELRRRSPRASAEHAEVLGAFKVYADTNRSPIRLTLAGDDLPGEFTVDFPDGLEEWQSELIWSAIRNKGMIGLLVVARIIKGEVKGAVILDVLRLSDVKSAVDDPSVD